MPAQAIAVAHIGQGSPEQIITQFSKLKSFLPAFLMTSISAWAVGSLAIVTRLTAMICRFVGFSIIMAENGLPFLFSRASFLRSVMSFRCLTVCVYRF